MHGHRQSEKRAKLHYFPLDVVHGRTYPDGMDDLLTPSDVERLAKARGMTMTEVCRRAEIAHTTFNRWKRAETEPTLGVYRRIVAAVQKDAA